MATSAKPGGGISGKPGMGGGGGVAGDASSTIKGRQANLDTAVGGLTTPGGANPPMPRPRPTGPSGPPKPAGVGAGPPLPRPRPTLNPSLLSPLINGRNPLTGATGMPPAEGMAQTQLDPSQMTNLPSGLVDPTLRPKKKRVPGSTEPDPYSSVKV